ncbi:MAG: hypothetical protein Q9208_003283 [Pyrenodesmia sp. 3 TL-2023]
MPALKSPPPSTPTPGWLVPAIAGGIVGLILIIGFTNGVLRCMVRRKLDRDLEANRSMPESRIASSMVEVSPRPVTESDSRASRTVSHPPPSQTSGTRQAQMVEREVGGLAGMGGIGGGGGGGGGREEEGIKRGVEADSPAFEDVDLSDPRVSREGSLYARIRESVSRSRTGGPSRVVV